MSSLKDNMDKNEYTGHVTVELAPEHLDLIKSLMDVVQCHSNDTMIELTEQLSEKWVHIDDVCMTRYVNDTIDSLRRKLAN